MTRARPRICINALLLQSQLDGIGNYCVHLIENLARQNPEWRLSLLVNAAAARHFRHLEPAVEMLAVGITRTEWRLLYLQGLFPFRALRFDLVHSVANIGAVFCPVPQVLTIHDAYEKVTPDRLSWLKRKQIILTKALSARNAAYVIANSQTTRRDIEHYYPGTRGKIRVVYMGNKFAAEPYAPRERRNFLALGTLDPGRNLAHVLEAYVRFPDKQAHKLVLFGAREGKESSLPSLLDSMGLREHVILRGHVSEEELKVLYRSSLAFIRAQGYDGFGLPVVEAMACGCPAIAARNSSLIEVGGNAALFFETGDVAGLAARMSQLASDPEGVEDVVRRGLEQARKFTWEKTAAETAAVYRRCLEKRPGIAPAPLF